MMSASIIPTSEVPPKDTKWAGVQNMLRKLGEKHSLVLYMQPGDKYDNVRSALYGIAERDDYRISIRRTELKLFITKLRD